MDKDDLYSFLKLCPFKKIKMSCITPPNSIKCEGIGKFSKDEFKKA